MTLSLKKLSRNELNQRAVEAGIAAPEKLGKKALVIAAIEETDSARPLTVTAAIKEDLRLLAERDPILARSGRAASALVLARELDEGRNSATSKSMCARALNETMDRLRELAPPIQVRDGVDDLNAAREKRLNGGAAATG